MSIELKKFGFSYSTKRVLHDIDLIISPGESLAILGPNGAGKTTLLNAIAGLIPYSIGEISYEGKKGVDMLSMAGLIGYVPQTIVAAFDYAVIDYVVTGCAPRIGTFGRPGAEHYATAAKAIEDMGISHLSGRSYRLISGGERQQVSIARVLAQNPKYILMDEPTAHLDLGNQISVLSMIRDLADRGYGVVFTTHNPDQALLVGGKVAIIDREGRLTHGDSHSLISEESLRGLYDIPLIVAHMEMAERKVCITSRL